MSAKKRVLKATSTTATENDGHNSQPGYLGKLKLLHRNQEVAIHSLNACQIRRKHADPATVTKYAEMLSETEPPAVVVLVDDTGRRYVGDGHNRVQAALEVGRSTIMADLYSGTATDARLVGLECNQHGLALTLAERKAALDDILDNDSHGFSDIVIARLVGLDRHTVQRRRRERQSGDFMAAAGKMRRIKTPEEMVLQAAMTFAGQVEKYGVAVVAKALEQLPLHLKEDAMRQLFSEGDSQ